MRTINVMVRDKIASAVGDIVYICDNSDYIINFDFDEEWDAYGVKPRGLCITALTPALFLQGISVPCP